MASNRSTNPFAPLESSDSDDEEGPSATRTSPAAGAAACTECGTSREEGTESGAMPHGMVLQPGFDAAKRLLRDLREVRAATKSGQLPTIAAEPADDDILEWRLTMTAPDGKYHGVVFHAEMSFSHEYPVAPPVIKLCTDLPHPNVFTGYDFNHHRACKGHYICLDMLKPATGSIYSGWSSAYTVLSILLQLQSFLFAEYVPQDDGRRIKSYMISGRPHGGRDTGAIGDIGNVPDAMRKRLARAGACTGEITVSLMWDSIDDLDLHCVGPGGDEISYFHRRGSCGGELDVDMNASTPYSAAPVENVHWQAAPKGRYRAWVENFCHRDESRDEIPFICILRRKGMQPLQHDGIWTPKTGTGVIFDFSWSGQVDCQGESIRAAHAFHEQHGRHYPQLPSPSPPPPPEATAIACIAGKEGHLVDVSLETAVTIAEPVVDWCDVDDDIWLAVCQLLEVDAISALLRTCKHFAEFGDVYRVFTRREMLCFHTRCSLEDQTLGICLRTKRRNPRCGQLCSSLVEVSCEFDLLSEAAFVECAVRRGVWGTHFDAWLPLVLDHRHAERSLPLLERYLTRLASPSLTATGACGFNPMIALEVLPRIMNALVVSLMEKGETSRFASEKSLLGFCALHHMLLELAVKYPIITQRAEHWVNEFASHESCRNKHVIHDLGELLILLYLCPANSWAEIAPVFIQEVLIRNVRWNIDKDKSLALMEPRTDAVSPGCVMASHGDDSTVSDYRLKATLRCCGTSLRLCMFQAFFLLNVGALPSGGIQQRAEAYRARLSRPRPRTAAKLQAACVDILGAGARNAQNRLSWNKFFERLELPVPTEAALSEQLRAAVVTSELRGYHRRLDGYEMEEATAIRESLDPRWCQQQQQHGEQQQANVATQCNATGKGRKIFVGNCPYNCSETELAALFQPFGVVLNVELPVATGRDAEAAAARAMAKTVSEARKILSEHGALHIATHIEVHLCCSGGTGGRHLTPQLEAVSQMSDTDVIKKAVELRPSWRGGWRALDSGGMVPCRGFAILEFAEQDAAKAAIRYGDRQLKLCRRVLRVSQQADRRPRNRKANQSPRGIATGVRRSRRRHREKHANAGKRNNSGISHVAPAG
eukprot:COSAG02_NODE_3521_length_6619_cov_27.887117_2_plen_1107_part_00